jgi:acylglycerol lipase
MIATRYHTPYKYGFNIDEPPTVPSTLEHGQKGKFSPSYDRRLWLFHRSWDPPVDQEIKATLLIIHGTVDHSGVYHELASKLAKEGIAVFAQDMRGWGYSDGERLYFNDIDTFVEDADSFYREIHHSEKYKTVKSRFILGKSLGGLVAAFTVAKYPNQFSGLIGLSGAFGVDQNQVPNTFVCSFLKLLNYFIPKLPLKHVFDPKLIVSDSNALETWRNDPLCCKDKVPLGYAVESLRCIRELSDSIVYTLHIPMLMMIGTDDKVVTKVGHEMMIKKSLASRSKKILKTYTGGYHNLLAEPALKEQVMEDIKTWILENL